MPVYNGIELLSEPITVMNGVLYGNTMTGGDLGAQKSGCVHERMIITRREVSIFSTSLIGSTKYVRKSNLKNVWVKG